MYYRLTCIVLSVLRYTDCDCPFGIFWPLCCLFFDIRIVITSLWYLQLFLVLCFQHNGQKIPKAQSQSVYRRTDNTMAKRYQRDNHNPYIEEQTTQWPKDTKGTTKNRISKNRQRSPPVFSGVSVTRALVLYVCFVDRCLSFCTCSIGHCVVCSSIYGFWLPFGIFWPLCCLLH
jgi:hypothetical protein